MVAHHPGLPNPEISKIIGDQWKNEHSDVKAQWNRLAEEEKLRHKRQFPDYRYQPRRGGNKGVPPRLTTSSGGPGQDPGRCPKCRGRYIATPRTPLTPYVSPPVSAGMASSGGPSLPYHYQQQQQQRWNHPPGHPAPPPPLYDIQEDYAAISPSDPKRRRYHAAPPPGGPNNPYQGLPSPSPSSTPYGTRHHQRTPSIPNTNNPYGPHGLILPNLARPNPTGYGPGPSGGGMPPPPRPGSLSGASSYPGPQGPRGSTSSSDFDESLRLPPLQTHHLPGTSVSPTDMQQQQPPRQDVGGGLQATVMSIPYVSKLTVLERISPPLPGPGPAGPARGPIIAVEGAEGHPRLLRVVGGIVERALVESGECEVRTWAVDGEMGRRGSAAVEVGGQGNLFGAYLKAMLEWHAKAAEMVAFVGGGGGRGSVGGEGGKGTPPPPQTVGGSSSTSTAMVVHAPPRQRRLPIALLPTGYSLTTADHFACAVPVHNDAYAPVDHWQWMATLWRGIAAADLVVYVRVVSDEELGAGQLQVVELKAPGLMVVRVPASVLGVEDGGIGEKAERRLGFEVFDWVRGGVFWHFWAGAGRGGGHGGQGGMGGYGREG